MMQFSARVTVLRAAVDRPVPKFILGLFMLVGAWDTLVGQFLPPEWAQVFPNFYQGLEMTSGFLPLWSWAFLGMTLVTGISIEYAFRKNKKDPSENHVLELVSSGRVLKLTVKRLWGIIGETRHALCFSWSSGESGAFDEIEGHHPTIYSHDFDGDGLPELIVRYHCGAHTHVMRIYKIADPPFGPKLIPGAEIGSDFPEITWQPRKSGEGVIIYAKNRNWEGSPASDPPVIERYIFENGQCVNIPHDRIVKE